MDRTRVCAAVVVMVLLAFTSMGAESDSKAVRNGPSPLDAGQDTRIEILAYDNGDTSPWAVLCKAK